MKQLYKVEDIKEQYPSFDVEAESVMEAKNLYCDYWRIDKKYIDTIRARTYDSIDLLKKTQDTILQW